MPTINKKTGKEDEGDWYVLKNTSRISGAPPVSTFQIDETGVNLLLDIGLDHASTPDRKAEFDDDLYYILNDLGSLSKKDDGLEPDAVLSKLAEYSTLRGLSESQRARLARSLLEQYTLNQLFCHESIFNFFAELESLPRTLIHNVLRPLLDGTPFDATVVYGCNNLIGQYSKHYDFEEGFYNPVILAVVLRYIYDRWDNIEEYDNLISSNEGEPIWIWDGWVAFGGTELMFHKEMEASLDNAPTPVQDGLASQVKHSELIPFYDFLQQGYSALVFAQTAEKIRESSYSLGKIVAEGLKTESTTRCGRILARPAQYSKEPPGAALEAAHDLNSNGIRTIERVFQQDN